MTSPSEFVPDKEHELDVSFYVTLHLQLNVLLEKAKELTEDAIALSPEETAPIEPDDASFDTVPLPLEPLSASDFEL